MPAIMSERKDRRIIFRVSEEEYLRLQRLCLAIRNRSISDLVRNAVDYWVSLAPLSVAPLVTLAHLLRAAGYTLVFFLLRELTWRSGDRPWRAALPLIVLATAEAALGMVQQLVAGQMATGTYVNRDHFAGLLELVPRY